LSINNIGKLKNAKVEIKGITVIAGENDTGKSTVGKILFSVFNSFYKLNEKIIKLKKTNIQNYLQRLITTNPFEDYPDFSKLIDDNIDNQSYQSFNADDISNYFIGLYIAFLNFNSHYERNKYTMVNNPRWPYGSNSFAIQSNIDTIYFQILDYNIGNFENIIIWDHL